jgi:endonuclease/exonuclease/phosphatase family metal-dependent hydrolase
MRLRSSFLAALLVLGACHSGYNYPLASGPRFTGEPRVVRAAGSPDTLRIASFNLEFALHVDSALATIRAEPALHDADVLLLQEMDEDATRRVAEEMGMRWVYYPALWHYKTHRNFGNAVLSRWPIADDGKILLPHFGLFGHTRRVAAAATIRVGEREVRVYSVHLGTLVNEGPGARRDQLNAVLADAARFPRVVIGGDMNAHGVGRAATAAGYAWPTENGPKTTKFGRFDHVFLKGIASPASTAAGTILDVHGASDHLAVWTVGLLR